MDAVAHEHPDATDAGTDASAEHAAKLARAVSTVSTWLASLIDPDQTVELRALKMHDGHGGHTVAGMFRGHELPALATAALTLSGNCQGVYYTLNPLKPERFVVQAPRMRRAEHGDLAGDRHVLTRRWVLIDVDPVRAAGASGESATDGEKSAAWDTLCEARRWLTDSEGWPLPIVSDSGNGYHLLYRVADDGGLPVGGLPTPECDTLRKVLACLAERFDTARVKIDRSVFNPARIVKFPGTLACKGSGEGERPWRRAKVLEIPASEAAGTDAVGNGRTDAVKEEFADL